MAMPSPLDRQPITAAAVLEFPPDGNRYELVAGELLVTPAPRRRHQEVVTRLTVTLSNYLRGLGRADDVFGSAADITWGVPPSESEELVQPDVFVIAPGQAGAEWTGVTRLELVAEVLSPGSARADRVLKRESYQRHGVSHYWVVDADAGLVEVWRPEDERPRIVTEALLWRAEGAAADLRVDVKELLA